MIRFPNAIVTSCVVLPLTVTSITFEYTREGMLLSLNVAFSYEVITAALDSVVFALCATATNL